jgi:hypothetical protein
MARFRKGLEPIERQILDTVVGRAREPSQEAAPVAVRVPAEPEVARLVEKIKAFEDRLPEGQCEFFDAVLTEAQASRSDVEAHRQLLWSRWDGIGPAFWVLYSASRGSESS